MKLYFSPGACSLAVHIALREVGAHFDATAVDLAKHADLISPNQQQHDVDLRLLDETTVLQRVGDFSLGCGDGQSAY